MTTSKNATVDHLIEVLASDLSYLPNYEQRKLKEAFWVRFNENPTCEPQNLTLADVQRVVGDPRLDRWWTQQGFKEWLRNQEEFRERAASIAHRGLDILEEAMADSSVPMSARIAAAKLAFEIARKMPSQQPTAGKFLDASIATMSQKQLEEYLARRAHLMPVPGTEKA